MCVLTVIRKRKLLWLLSFLLTFLNLISLFFFVNYLLIIIFRLIWMNGIPLLRECQLSFCGSSLLVFFKQIAILVTLNSLFLIGFLYTTFIFIFFLIANLFRLLFWYVCKLFLILSQIAFIILFLLVLLRLHIYLI